MAHEHNGSALSRVGDDHSLALFFLVLFDKSLAPFMIAGCRVVVRPTNTTSPFPASSSEIGRPLIGQLIAVFYSSYRSAVLPYSHIGFQSLALELMPHD